MRINKRPLQTVGLLLFVNGLVFYCLSLRYANSGNSDKATTTRCNLFVDSLKPDSNDAAAANNIDIVAPEAAAAAGTVAAAHPLTCSEIDRIELKRELGKGTTKKVHLGRLDGTDVVVKRVTADVEDIKACKRRGKYWKISECFLYANYKILKEILMRQQLNSRYLLKLLGYCVRNENNGGSLANQGVVAITEVGKPVDLDSIIALPFIKKLRLLEGVASFLDYMEHGSPLGSLILTDFKLTQMFIVEDVLKFGDLDDINNLKQSCSASSDCGIDKINFGIPCIHSVCEGYNAKFNLYHFNRAIIKHILLDPPVNIEDKTVKLLINIQNLRISARELQSEIVELLNLINKAP